MYINFVDFSSAYCGTNQWAAAKDADVVEKVRIATIIARKSRGDIEICWSSSTDVLGPTEPKGAGGTGGTEEAGEVGSRAVTVKAMAIGI